MERSSRPEVFFKKRVRPASLFKKRLWHRYFAVNFVKFLMTLFDRTSSVAASDWSNISAQQANTYSKL